VALANDVSVVMDVRSKAIVADKGPAATRIAWHNNSIGCLRDGAVSFWDISSRQIAEADVTQATCIAADERSFVVGDANGYIHTWGAARKATAKRAHVGLCGDAIDTAQLPVSLASTLTDMMDNLRALTANTANLATRVDVTEEKLRQLKYIGSTDLGS